MSLIDFVHIYILINQATSIIKIQQFPSSLSLNDIGIFLNDGPFKSDIGIVNLHPFQGTHWVLYINENYFDSYVCAPANKLCKFSIKRNGHRLQSTKNTRFNK